MRSGSKSRQSAMSEAIVFGAAYSVYVRTVRLALAEKAAAYRLEEIDIFADGGPPADYVQRHPFKRIPAFEHDGFRLYETGAIARYVDEAFAGPALMPDEPRTRARANQIVGIVDNYAYRSMVWGVFTECVRAPAQGKAGDEALIASSLGVAGTCLDAFEGLASAEGPGLLGPTPTLADLYLAPMMRYFTMAKAGADMLATRPRLSAWWQWMQARPSMAATRSPME
jgi:glutathione S-transferase